MAHNYIIRVTAGTTRDVTEHQLVAVNTAEPIKIENDLIEARVNVRVKNYHGLPRNSPVTSPYFAAEPHAYNDDQYSIALSFRLKEPPEGRVDAKDADAKENDDDAAPADENDEDRDLGVKGGDLQWGNDFDHPIRDRLPPGFNTALNIVRWWIDPGLEGDAYADSPYLYGPALSSFNQMRVGPPSTDRVPVGKGADVEGKDVGLWIEEGANDEALFESRRSTGAPDDAKARMKWALKADSKERWVWEYGKEYSVDFFNPYIDFEEFALRLPGFHLPIMKYWDGQGMRYVLRNRKTGDLYLAVTFSLYLKDDVNEDGSLKPGTIEAQKKDSRTRKSSTHQEDHGKHDDNEPHDDEKSIEEARKKLQDVKVKDSSRPDDVD